MIMDSKERRSQLQGKLAELEASLVVSPEKLTEFVKRWRGGFRNYSLHNFLLILWQKPEATIGAKLEVMKIQREKGTDWFYKVKVNGLDFFVVLNETSAYPLMFPEDY